jgi:CheY-like chemotaxis protein
MISVAFQLIFNLMKKILLIEDEEIMIDILQRKLSKEGYEVSKAVDGKEGLEIMKEVKPDLVLLDIVMPKMGGFEVMEAMAKDSSLKRIPIIVISNSGQPVEINRVKEMGAKDWLIKTEFDPQEVLDKVRRQIGK